MGSAFHWAHSFLPTFFLFFKQYTFVSAYFVAGTRQYQGGGRNKVLALEKQSLAGRLDSTDCLGRLGKDPGEHSIHQAGWQVGGRQPEQLGIPAWAVAGSGVSSSQGMLQALAHLG